MKANVAFYDVCVIRQLSPIMILYSYVSVVLTGCSAAWKWAEISEKSSCFKNETCSADLLAPSSSLFLTIISA